MTKLQPADPISKVPFIGDSYAKLLEKLNIKTVNQLLRHYPFRYDDYTKKKAIKNLVIGETASTTGRVEKIKTLYAKNKKTITKIELRDESGTIESVWFNQPYLAKSIGISTLLSVSGKVGEFSGKSSFISPEYEFIKSAGNQKTIHTGRLVPIYPETARVSSKWLRSRINQVLLMLDEIEDPLPIFIKRENNLQDLDMALRTIHFPEKLSQLREARRRLGFDEIFEISLRGSLRRKAVKLKKAAVCVVSSDISPYLNKLTGSLPFKLTLSQKEVISEMLKDLSKPFPMNRLLQGEVGSGKTIVAILASLSIVKSGKSVVVMAPTEVLAIQHYMTFKNILEPLNVAVSLITGSNKKTDFSSNVIIGTHAIIHSHSFLKNGGLIIVDEQHKFGVAQRAKIIELLSDNEQVPHLLTMTATPIPRTLSLTYLGDLDISILRESPIGRKAVKTWYVPESKRSSAYSWVKNQINLFRTQVFIICPLIEESETESLKSVKSAKTEYEKIKGIFSEYTVGLLHGKLKPREKQSILNDFRSKKIQIMVTTPVVEVGIDIPNLTIIIIEGSERFGLASLHQLRGRVGRSDKESYCLLFSESTSPDAVKRLKNLEKIYSGLELAQLDLERRGPGEIFGLLQSGLSILKIADLSDFQLIESATLSSRSIVEDEKYHKELVKLLENTDRDCSKTDLN